VVVFQSGWIRVFHTRWVLSGQHLGSLGTLSSLKRGAMLPTRVLSYFVNLINT
jgi:hypothetical protein